MLVSKPQSAYVKRPLSSTFVYSIIPLVILALQLLFK